MSTLPSSSLAHTWLRTTRRSTHPKQSRCDSLRSASYYSDVDFPVPLSGIKDDTKAATTVHRWQPLEYLLRSNRSRPLAVNLHSNKMNDTYGRKRKRPE